VVPELSEPAAVAVPGDEAAAGEVAGLDAGGLTAVIPAEQAVRDRIATEVTRAPEQYLFIGFP
jgi:hypothetical protein